MSLYIYFLECLAHYIFVSPCHQKFKEVRKEYDNISGPASCLCISAKSLLGECVYMYLSICCVCTVLHKIKRRKTIGERHYKCYLDL